MPDMSTALVTSDVEPPSVRRQLKLMALLWSVGAVIILVAQALT